MDINKFPMTGKPPAFLAGRPVSHGGGARSTSTVGT